MKKYVMAVIIFLLGWIPVNASEKEEDLTRGREFLNEGKIVLAIEHLTNAITKNPDNVTIYYYLGQAYLKKENIDKAIETFKKASELEPTNPELHYYLGESFRIKMERTSWINFLSKRSSGRNAYNELMKAIELKPDHFEAHLSIGKLYYYPPVTYKKIDEAIKKFQECVRIKPDSAEGYYWLGKAYQKKGEESLAVVEWEKALQIEPDNAKVKEALSNIKKR